MFNIFKKRKEVVPPPAFKIERIELDWAIDYSVRKDLIPCKMCGRYDEEVKPIHTQHTNVFVGHLHPWCASQMIHDTMKELIRRMQ